MKELAFVFLGGGIGASSRWGISLVFNQILSKAWSGTLAANLLGCLLIFLGSRFGWFETKMTSHLWRIGFLGSLTTFSTFSYEVVECLKQGRMKEALLILGLNIVFGILIGIGIFR